MLLLPNDIQLTTNVSSNKYFKIYKANTLYSSASWNHDDLMKNIQLFVELNFGSMKRLNRIIHSR